MEVVSVFNAQVAHLPTVLQKPLADRAPLRKNLLPL